MSRGIIIYVFPCGGKSFYCSINNQAIELKSEKYRWLDFKEGELNKGNMNQLNPKWPQNYLDDLYISVSKFDYVFISNSGRLLCQEHNLQYYSVFPYLELKDEYINRMINRKNSENLIENMKCNYEKYICCLENDIYAKRICRLSAGEYLSDLMEGDKIGIPDIGTSLL